MKIKSLFTIILSAAIAFAISSCQKQETVELNQPSEETETVKISELTKSFGNEVLASKEDVNAAIKIIGASVQETFSDTSVTEFFKSLESALMLGESGLIAVDYKDIAKFIEDVINHPGTYAGIQDSGKTIKIAVEGYYLEINLPTDFSDTTVEFVIGKDDCEYASAAVNLVKTDINTKLYLNGQDVVVGAYYKFSYSQEFDLKNLVLWYNNQTYRTNIQIKNIESIYSDLQCMSLGYIYFEKQANSLAESFNSNVTRIGGEGTAIIDGNDFYAVAVQYPNTYLYGVNIKYGDLTVDVLDFCNFLRECVEGLVDYHRQLK